MSEASTHYTDHGLHEAKKKSNLGIASSMNLGQADITELIGAYKSENENFHNTMKKKR